MMTANYSKTSKSLLLMALASTVFACSKSKFSASQANNNTPLHQTNNTRPGGNGGGYIPPQQRPIVPPGTGYRPPVSGNSGCKDYEYDFPKYNGPRGVNVWVVMDPSKSQTSEERYTELKGLVEMYENTVARDIPIYVAVIAGHSRSSSDSALSGHIFYRNDNRQGSQEPFILSFGGGQKDSTRAKMLNYLKLKTVNMRTDNSPGVSDGGELLTVNLLAALQSQRAMNTVQPGDVLNIHFMTDENDICTIGQVEDYNKITLKNGKKISREEYARQQNCGHMNVTDNGHGYSQTLADAINSLRNDKDASGKARVIVHTSAFVYTNESTVPHFSSTDENEVGRGIYDLVDATGGKSFDLATLLSTMTDGQANLQAAGAENMEHINQSGNMYGRVRVIREDGRAADFSDFDSNRSQVFVDGRRVEYRISQDGYIQMNRRCPIDGKKVRIRYCLRR